MKTDFDIIICGDLCPTIDSEKLFEENNAEALFGDLYNKFGNADFVVGNLEAPLVDEAKPIKKCGPHLKGKPAYIGVLKKAGFHLLGIANNHIRDYGDEGVISTIQQCETSGISTVGGGSIEQARRPYILTKKGWRIGVLAFAEHEFNIAEGTKLGANLFDPYCSFDDIVQTKTECDFLIVLYHGGIEHYPYPSPLLQKKCRKIIEKGADIVLCQHSHCIGSEEKYLNGTVLYGQGNTLFGYRKNNDRWNHGLVVNLKLKENSKEIIYTPIAQQICGADTVKEPERNVIIDELNKNSQLIKDPAFIETQWKDFVKSKEAHYLPMLYGWNRLFVKANRVLKNFLLNCIYSKKKKMVTCNLIRCDAHNEIFADIFKKHLE